jgi:hypothetical protein
MMLQTDFFHRPAFLPIFSLQNSPRKKLLLYRLTTGTIFAETSTPKKHHEKYNRSFGKQRSLVDLIEKLFSK